MPSVIIARSIIFNMLDYLQSCELAEASPLLGDVILNYISSMIVAAPSVIMIAGRRLNLLQTLSTFNYRLKVDLFASPVSKSRLHCFMCRQKSLFELQTRSLRNIIDDLRRPSKFSACVSTPHSK